MLIGVDLDSVLADLMIPLNEFHNRRYGTQLSVNDYVEYNLASFWGCSSDKAMQRVYEFYLSPMMETLPLIPGALQGIDYLHKNHELVVITSRPDMTKPSTLNWINTYFPKKFAAVILSNQFSSDAERMRTKGEIGRELGINAMIDDHLDYIEDCVEHGIQGVLFDATWNKSKVVSEKIMRMHDWSEVSKFF